MNTDIELKLSEEAGRGARAEKLLNDDLFKEAFRIVEEDTLAKWKASPVRDQEGQLVLRLKMQVLQEVQTLIRDAAVTGRLATEQLKRERTMKDRLKAVFSR